VDTQAPAARTWQHRRQVDSTGYRRDDGLWEVEARMSDVKSHTMCHPAYGALPADEPYQAFLIRLVLDDALVLRDVRAEITTAPAGECRQIETAYAALAGLVLDRGVMRQARAAVGGTAGCTNLTELFGIAVVTALQMVGGRQLGAPGDDGAALLRLRDGCHALRAEGEILRLLKRPGGKGS
jgi:Protein of unknown function (DUF2889)